MNQKPERYNISYHILIGYALVQVPDMFVFFCEYLKKNYWRQANSTSNKSGNSHYCSDCNPA